MFAKNLTVILFQWIKLLFFNAVWRCRLRFFKILQNSNFFTFAAPYLRSPWSDFGDPVLVQSCQSTSIKIQDLEKSKLQEIFAIFRVKNRRFRYKLQGISTVLMTKYRKYYAKRTGLFFVNSTELELVSWLCHLVGWLGQSTVMTTVQYCTNVQCWNVPVDTKANFGQI